MFKTFSRRIASAGLPMPELDREPIREADLADLPESVQRYFRFMGVLGRARDWSFRAHFTGRFRMRPGQRWMPLESWQYNFAPTIARLFYLRVRVAGVVPMYGWDTYLGGRGRMLGKLLGLVTVVDGKGDQFDIGELVTYLNDAIIMAPSMLLDSATTWSELDRQSFDVSLSDSGRTVGARVLIDDRGAPINFSTDDRFAALPGGLTRAQWTTPLENWRVVDGRPHPERGSAIWHLVDGPFPYAEFHFRDDSVA